MSKLKHYLKFIHSDVWHLDMDQYPRVIQWIIRQIRVFLLAFKGFTEDRISLRASSLTFFSLLSIVPVVAMAFGIAKGFGFQDRLENEIMGLLDSFDEGAQQSAMRNLADTVINFANSMLERTKGGFIAGIGLVVLLYSVMRVLGNIEKSFNHIWQIKKSRPFLRKFSDYLSMMLIAPILVLLSSSANVFISTTLAKVSESSEIVGAITPAIQSLLKLIPYFSIFLLFSLIYIIMPNTRVKFRYAFPAAVIAGIIFQLIQSFYINSQVLVSSYNAIYGSFMALPLFLIWMQISWLVVLFGAELSFAYQNIEEYEFEATPLEVSPYNRQVLAYMITYLVVKKFETGERPLTSDQISKILEVPLRVVRSVINELIDSEIIAEAVTAKPKEHGYMPAMDINKLTTGLMMEKLARKNTGIPVGTKFRLYPQFMSLHEKIFDAIKSSDANRLIKDIP